MLLSFLVHVCYHGRDGGSTRLMLLNATRRSIKDPPLIFIFANHSSTPPYIGMQRINLGQAVILEWICQELMRTFRHQCTYTNCHKKTPRCNLEDGHPRFSHLNGSCHSFRETSKTAQEDQSLLLSRREKVMGAFQLASPTKGGEEVSPTHACRREHRATAKALRIVLSSLGLWRQ